MRQGMAPDPALPSNRERPLYAYRSPRIIDERGDRIRNPAVPDRAVRRAIAGNRREIFFDKSVAARVLLVDPRRNPVWHRGDPITVRWTTGLRSVAPHPQDVRRANSRTLCAHFFKAGPPCRMAPHGAAWPPHRAA